MIQHGQILRPAAWRNIGHYAAGAADSRAVNLGESRQGSSIGRGRSGKLGRDVYGFRPRQPLRPAGQREGLAWWNFAFLFTITVMPFTSSLVGAFPGNPLAVDIFAVNLLLASLATQATLIFGRSKGLVIERSGPESMFAGRMRLLANTLVIALSIAAAWVSTGAAKYCWLLLALAPRVADRLTVRHERAKSRAQGRG